MKNKIFLMGILMFGFIIVNSLIAQRDALFGIWVNTDGYEYHFNNGNYLTMQHDGTLWEIGTYTISGSVLIQTPTHRFLDQNEPRVYSRDEWRNNGYPDFDLYFSPQTYMFLIRGDTLTLVHERGPTGADLYTKIL